MSERTDAEKIRPKISRQRRRLYDPVPAKPESAKPFLPFPRPESDNQRRYKDAQHIIVDYTMWSAGTGLIPAPFFDMLAMLAIEIRMVKRLSALYGVPFSKERGRSLLAALLSGVHAGLWTNSCLKLVPFFGLAGVVVPMVAISGGITYAVGRVFVQHFESGGTLLDFRPEKMRRYYLEQIKKGQDIVAAQHARK